jgi:hypothetical protein
MKIKTPLHGGHLHPLNQVGQAIKLNLLHSIRIVQWKSSTRRKICYWDNSVRSLEHWE